MGLVSVVSFVGVLALGCAATEAPEAGPSIGRRSSGGVGVPWKADLKPAGEASFYAAVVGLSTVELLTIIDGIMVVTPMPTPEPEAGCGFVAPVSLLRVDVDRDGAEDLLVHDLCGSYVVSDPWGKPVAEQTSRWIEGDGPFEFLDVSEEAAAGVFATGSLIGFSFFASNTRDGKWTSLGSYNTDTPSAVKPKDSIVPIADTTGTRWLMLESQSIVELSLLPRVAVQRKFEQHELTMPSLLPFETFDDIALVSHGDDCGTVLLASGRFGTQAANAPAPPILITLSSDDESLRSIYLDTSLDVASVAHARHGGVSLAGILGSRDGEPVFELLVLSECTDAARVASIATTISERRAPMPGLNGALRTSPRQNRLIALTAADKVIFATYDGFDARLYTVSESQNTWTVTEQLVGVHTERTDLAFP